MYKRASSWSTKTGIPVMINEFGAAKYDYANEQNKCQLVSRLEYLRHHVTEATRHGIAATFWDDGGSFSSYDRDRKSTRLNSSHVAISYAVFCLKKKTAQHKPL